MNNDSIRFYRCLRQVEQKELAAVLGKTPSALCRIEKGENQISANDLETIAHHLRVPIQRFFEPLPSVDVLIDCQEPTHV